MISRRHLLLSTAGIGPLVRVSSRKDVDLQSELQKLGRSGGGTYYIPAGVIPFSEKIEVPSGVNLWGQGSGWGRIGGTELRATSAGAQLRFGTKDRGSYGGLSGNFTVNGNGIAVQPFYVGRVLHRTFMALDVVQAARDCIRIEEAQNCLFLNVNSDKAGRYGLVLDRGAGGHLFDRCGVNGAGACAVVIAQTAVRGGLLYAHPSHNQFRHCVFERTVSGRALHHSRGQDNVFDTTVFAVGNLIRAADLLLAGPGTIRLRIRDSIITGDPKFSTRLAVADDASVILSGVTRFNGLFALGRLGKRARVAIEAVEQSSVRNSFLGPGRAVWPMEREGTPE